MPIDLLHLKTGPQARRLHRADDRTRHGALPLSPRTGVIERLSALFLVEFLLSSSLLAREHAPRVLSSDIADSYSLKTFAEFARWKDLQGCAKVLAVFEYLTDPRTGLYPMGAGAWEGEDDLYEYGFIRDPVKMINVYPCGYCDMLGPVAAGIFEGMGAGRARTVGLPGLSHVFAEVEVGGRWAYVDLDLRAVFLKADGTLASTEDARKDPGLWARLSGPRFFPLDDLAGLREAYSRSPVEYRYGVAEGGHTMDYVLRRGETFTRWWKPQGDRWNHHRSYHEEMREVLEREPRGPKCKHGEAFTIHTRGNGRYVYAPNLTDRSDDFADGVYDSRNVQTSPAGLTLETPGSGYAVFEFRTPYVIVPRVGRYESTEDDAEASVVEADADGAVLQVSVDNGFTWRPLMTPGAAAKIKKEPIDLTRQVAGRYGYLLRIALEGSPGRAVVRGLKVTTWVELHPASLPSLRKGRNPMRYVTGDHHGLPTRVVGIRTNGSERWDFLRHLVEPPADFDPARKTERAKGPFVVRVDAPPETRIAWFSAGASFATHQGEQAPRTGNSIAYAVGPPGVAAKDFREVYRAAVPASQSHWHYNADVEVKLDSPAGAIFLRYVGDPGVNNYRIYAHCMDDRPRPSSRGIVITHGWRERGEPRTRRVTLTEPGPYEVFCDDDPTDEFIELAVPGGSR